MLGAVPLRKQYLGSPRTPRATAVSTEEVVEVSGGRLNVQRSVSHTVCSSEEAGAALRASPALPSLDDFSALRAELVRVSCLLSVRVCGSVESQLWHVCVTQAVEADNELTRLADSAVAQSPSVARASLSAAGYAIQFQHRIDHEQWSL